MIFKTTPSQTVGPYFAIGLPWAAGPHAVAEGTAGAITISGTIYDGHGEPVPDHLLETWQADPDGRFADAHGYGGRSELEGFRGFARYGVEDGDGSYEIVTVKPGPVPGLDGTTQAPHIDVTLLARGMLNRVVTRIYFADEPSRTRPTRCSPRCRPSAAARCWPSRSRAVTGSTSACRATARPSSSPSDGRAAAAV